jgi:hypothetical protein
LVSEGKIAFKNAIIPQRKKIDELEFALAIAEGNVAINYRSNSKELMY